MPSRPTSRDLHVNAVLTDLSVDYFNSAEWSVADKVFPVVPVKKQSDRYYVYDKADSFRVEARIRASGSESAGGTFGINNNQTYFCDVTAIHHDISDQELANYDTVLDAQSMGTNYCSKQLLMARDLQWATAYFNATAWSNPVFTGANWTLTSSDPIRDILGQKDVIHAATGMMPNVLVLGAKVATALRTNDEVLDRIKYVQPGIVDLGLVASAAGLTRVLEARIVQNTAVSGATAALNYVVNPRSALLVYAAPAPALQTPSAGYTFAWTGLLGTASGGQRIRNFRIEERSVERVEGEMAYDMKVVGADLGVYMENLVP